MCPCPSVLQKRMRFVFDLSQSMTRGNSWDGRLDRMAQAAVLIMESLAGFEHKFHYSIYGQSGSSACVKLWDPEVPDAVPASPSAAVAREVQRPTVAQVRSVCGCRSRCMQSNRGMVYVV